MNRIVLAFLALFAGIAAQVSPAEARVRGETEIGSVLAQKAAARVAAAVQIAAVLQPCMRSEFARADACPSTQLERRVAVATVRLGPDRALE